MPFSLDNLFTIQLRHVLLKVKSVLANPSPPTPISGTDGIVDIFEYMSCLFYQTVNSVRAEIIFSLSYPALKTMTGTQQQMLNMSLLKECHILLSPF